MDPSEDDRYTPLYRRHASREASSSSQPEPPTVPPLRIPSTYSMYNSLSTMPNRPLQVVLSHIPYHPARDTPFTTQNFILADHSPGDVRATLQIYEYHLAGSEHAWVRDYTIGIAQASTQPIAPNGHQYPFQFRENDIIQVWYLQNYFISDVHVSITQANGVSVDDFALETRLVPTATINYTMSLLVTNWWANFQLTGYRFRRIRFLPRAA